MTYKIISLDLHGCIHNGEFDTQLWDTTFIELVAKKQHISFEKANEIVQKDYKESKEEFEGKWFSLQHWIDRYGLEESVQEICTLAKHALYIYDDVVPTIKELQKKEYQVIITTQAYKDIYAFIIKEIGISNLEVFSSSYHKNTDKKDEELYRYVIETLQVHPKYILHIGSSTVTDKEIPQKLGIDSYNINRIEREKGNVHTLQDIQLILDHIKL